MQKKKILYLMHVHWRWIKQRPHFIAEYLAEEYDVMVCYCKSYHSRTLVDGPAKSKVRLKELFVLPYTRFKLIMWINSWLIKQQLSYHLHNCDIVWIMHPNMYGAVKSKLSDEVYVVYDCMDDALEFPYVTSSTSLLRRLTVQENALLMRSNAIFATSKYLKKKLLHRYKIKKKIHIINNAINIYANNNKISNIGTEISTSFTSKETKKIAYIGTISKWFDFDMIIKSVNKFVNITYILIGPTEVPIPCHERIIHFPPVEHEMIFNIMEMADALVMPFVVNELVLSVNPVKIYEYIYMNKPAIVSDYEETEKFSEYVYLYKTSEEYLYLIELLSNNKLKPKRSLEDNISFAKENTWKSRVSEISAILPAFAKTDLARQERTLG